MMNFCSSRQTSSKILFILPSTIFSTTLAGLPVARAWAVAISFSLSRKDWVTSSLVTNWGAGSWAATCMAISRTRRWKFSVRATKSVSQLSSIEHADPAAGVDVGFHDAFGGDAAGLGGGGGQALLAQVVDGLLHVAAVLFQRLLAIHHAEAGLVAEGFHIQGGICHGELLVVDRGFKELSGQAPGSEPAPDRCWSKPRLRRLLHLLGHHGLHVVVVALVLEGLAAFEDGVGDALGEQQDGADGVVVGGDHVVDLVGVAVGVHQADDLDAQLGAPR